MRLHYSFQAVKLLRTLGSEGVGLRRTIESLLNNPIPDDVLVSKARPGRYELFHFGYWIVYEIDQSGAETIIRVTAIEENR